MLEKLHSGEWVVMPAADFNRMVNAHAQCDRHDKVSGVLGALCMILCITVTGWWAQSMTKPGALFYIALNMFSAGMNFPLVARGLTAWWPSKSNSV